MQLINVLTINIEFAESEGASFISRKLALRWATQPADAQPSQWSNRLGMVRRFAEYLSATDPRTEIPPQELLPYRYRRKPPYIYTDVEILNLICGSETAPTTGRAPSTYIFDSDRSDRGHRHAYERTHRA